MDPNTPASPEVPKDSTAATTPPAAPAPSADEDALETPESNISATNVTDATTASPSAAAAAPPPKKPGIKAKLKKFNLYLLLFVFIIVIAAGIVLVAYFQSSKKTTSSIKAQTLTQSDLSQLANSNATVGDPKQVLNVESNAVFAGQVLIRGALQVAGNLEIGGTLSVQNLNVVGQGTFGALDIAKNLSVGGNSGITGQETIGQSLQVNGTGSFNGNLSAPQITTSNLMLNADLTLDHHLIAGGPNPSRTTGPALGSGGTVSISGSDTSGSVSVNTGGGPPAGCFVTITFSSAYSVTPHVLVTPIGSAAGGIAYYVNRSNTNFSICDATAPPAGASFGFDYFVVD
jgi:cytoskeletal protein CcmA (bactofilin family)